jgi:outer membrane protein assembly factor BamB
MATRTGVVFVGTKGTVLAIDRSSGETVWQTDLKGNEFVDVMFVDGDLFAASKGIVSIAGSHSAGAAEKMKRDQAAAAAGAASAS